MSVVRERSHEAASRRDRVWAYVALTKPRIIELLLVTALPTMFLAARGLPGVVTIIAVLLGGTCAAAGANTFNSLYDRDIDEKMHRTSARPAVLGLVSIKVGIVQGILLSAASALVLALLTNLLAAALALAAIVMYAVGYTMVLKRRTSQNIVWGGAAGCMPVLIAWSAVTGTLTWTPVVLFLVIFFWTPPHYWPLAIKFRDQYAEAGVPMLPSVRPLTHVAVQIVLYAWITVLVSLSLIPVAGMGLVYTLGAIGLGAMFLVMAYQVQRAVGRAVRGDSGMTAGSVGDPVATETTVESVSMRLFHGSILYLAALFLLIAVDPFLHLVG